MSPTIWLTVTKSDEVMHLGMDSLRGSTMPKLKGVGSRSQKMFSPH